MRNCTSGNLEIPRFDAEPVIGPRVARTRWHRPGMRGVNRSRPRRAADVDHVAVTGRGILLDETGDQHAPVERDDLTILLGAGRSGWTDIILAARTALETQFLRRRLVGQMHDHAAGRPGSDHVRLLALRPRCGLGARAITGILERCKAPAADNLVGPDRSEE